MGGIALKASLEKNSLKNDSKKLNRIFALSGLNVKDGKQTLTTQLIKKRNYDWGTEYRYRIPLGRSFDDYVSKQKTIESGINTRNVRLELKDLRKLSFDKKLIKNIKKLYTKKLEENKEIELSYDGMLIVRVYEKPMSKEVELIEGDAWKVHFGITREKNEQIYHCFETFAHFSLGGATRYGKSNLLNCIITSLIKQQPDNLKMFLVDLKGGVELCDYENIKQTVSIAYEPEEALQTLEKAYDRMIEIQNEVKRKGKKKSTEAGINEHNFVIIDEVGELNPDEAVDREEKILKQRCQKFMSQIARKGAGFNFHLILASQYLTGDVIPRQCKQNSDAKLCFRVQSGTASRVILDTEGAENLPEIRGRAIYQTADKRTIIQTPLIDSETIQNAIRPHIVEKEEIDIEPPKQETGRDIAIFEDFGFPQ
jgi:DNA segregation ATPase FtsK/SpoIIIE, S-DNA-T family